MFTIYKKAKPIARVELKMGEVLIFSETQLIHRILKNILSRPHFLRDKKGHRIITDNKKLIVEDILRTKISAPYRVEKDDKLKGATKYMNKVVLYDVN